MHPNSNGNYKALLIGINYVGQQGELRGCHNDVESMKGYLLDSGYPEDAMRVVCDDGNCEMEPTHDNIIESFRWLTNGARAGDSLFFHYSGHGGSMRDTSGDEEDRMDETVVCRTPRPLLANLAQPSLPTQPSPTRLRRFFFDCRFGWALEAAFLPPDGRSLSTTSRLGSCRMTSCTRSSLRRFRETAN